MSADLGLGHDRDVELLAIERLADEPGVADEHRRLDARIALLQALQQFRQADQRKAFVETEAQHAVERVAGVEALDHLARGLQHAIGVLDECVPFGGQADARPPADEQRRVEHLLELADALRHGRLRQVEIARRGVKAPQPNDPLERAQLAQGHVHDR